MELEYVLRAVRRFWPIVLVSIALGVLAGELVAPDPTPQYSANALLLVTPAAGGGFGNTAGDRYISSQLVVLEAPPMAARASRLADVGLSEAAIAQSVTFFQIPGTDVVRITGVSTSPENAQAIANAYLDAYLEESEASVDVSESSDSALDLSITEIEEQLSSLNEQIDEALAPFRDRDSEESVRIEDVAPELATARDVILDKYRELLLRRASLEFEPQSSPIDPVIQRASLPTEPTAESSRLFSVGIAVAFTLFGVAAATVLARASHRVLDAREVTEVLGAPFAAVVPHAMILADGPLDRVQRLPDEMRDVVNGVCVLAEAQGSAGRSLTVLVTGSQRASGTTTLAACVAARFGQRGSRVALLDLDFDQLDISRHFDVSGDGFSHLLDIGRAAPDGRRGGIGSATDVGRSLGERMPAADDRLEQTDVPDDVRAAPDAAFTPTGLPNVSVVGRQPGLEQLRPQRMDLLFIPDVASRFADVVVIDAGPLLAESAGAVLAQHVDAVILTVPVKVQERAPLRTVARHLAALGPHLLPVATPELRPARPPRRTSAPTTVPADDRVEPVSEVAR